MVQRVICNRHWRDVTRRDAMAISRHCSTPQQLTYDYDQSRKKKDYASTLIIHWIALSGNLLAWLQFSIASSVTDQMVSASWNVASITVASEQCWRFIVSVACCTSELLNANVAIILLYCSVHDKQVLVYCFKFQSCRLDRPFDCFITLKWYKFLVVFKTS